MANFLANGRALRRATLLFAALCGTFSPVASADSFDVPLKKKVVDFGPSPYVGGYRIRLSCYFCRAFVVMEYHEGQKGAEWLAIVPLQKGVVPECIHPKAQGKIIEGSAWSGYFKGVKGNLVFFDAADGTDGGIPFAVYDSGTGKKIFEDSAYEVKWAKKKVVDAPFNRLRINKTSDGRLSLRYLRVVEAGCDLSREEAVCWQKVKNKLDLKNTRMPVCRDYTGRPTPYESAIAYPVEVFLFPQPSTKTIAGPVKRWPVD